MAGILGLNSIDDDSQNAIDIATSIAQIEEAHEASLNSLRVQHLLAQQAMQQKNIIDREAAERAAIAALSLIHI